MQNVDLAIVGGGPAGLAAAIKAKEAGLERIVLIERGEYLGGLLDQCIHNGFGLSYFEQDLTGPEYAQRFIDKASRLGIECLLNSMVVRLFADRRLVISNGKGISHLAAKAIVLSMGCRERTREALKISGSRPAGVLSAGRAQRYINVYGFIPGKKAVVLGSGDVGMIVARRLALEGVEVSAVVEALPYLGGLIRNKVQCLDDFNIPLLLKHTITEIRGTERLKGVTIAGVDALWNPIPGTQRELECDTLLISAGLIPENELSRMSGILLDPLTGGPSVTNTLETSVSGVFAAGNVLHVNDLVDNVSNEGEKAGLNAANFVMGKSGGKTLNLRLKPANNVRCVVPQAVKTLEDVTLSLRVREPAEKVRITVGGRVLKTLRAVRPGEMVKVLLSSQNLAELSSSCEETNVACESGG